MKLFGRQTTFTGMKFSNLPIDHPSLKFLLVDKRYKKRRFNQGMAQRIILFPISFRNRGEAG